MSRPIPYGHIERDLSALARQRATEALVSVLQLATTPGQAFLIATETLAAVAGFAAGAYAKHWPELRDIEPLELAIFMLTEAKRAADDRSESSP